ncbi:MAG: hypothetical protein ACP5D7_10665 [Limnospira sp.]
MVKRGKIYCFRASYDRSQCIDGGAVPDWLSVNKNWRGYRISTRPWVADVARVLGTLPFEDTPLGWRHHLESLGFREVIQVSCEELFEDTLFS